MASLGGLSLKSMNFMASVPEGKEKHLMDESCRSHDEEEAAEHTADESTSEIAGKENRMVRYSKVLVLLVIFVVAAAIGTVTYSFIKSQEDKTYKRQFRIVSSELVSVSQTRAREIFDNLEALSAHVTSAAAARNMEWPFVVIDDFQVHGVVSNKMVSAVVVCTYVRMSVHM